MNREETLTALRETGAEDPDRRTYESQRGVLELLEKTAEHE